MSESSWPRREPVSPGDVPVCALPPRSSRSSSQEGDPRVPNRSTSVRVGSRVWHPAHAPSSHARPPGGAAVSPEGVVAAPSPRFNLVDEPWISVRLLDGSLETVSLDGVFRRAGQIRELAGDIGLQDFALLRLLLAVAESALRDDTREPVELWQALRAEPGALAAATTDYLTRWRERFELFDPARPFFQVAGLSTGNEQLFPLERLVVDVPNDVDKQFFTTRAGVGLRRLGFGEAARWLVAAQQYDPSGIKTGVLGDARVKGGRGYPIGTAPAAAIGGIALNGENLEHTLLLNLVLGETENGVRVRSDADIPAWELGVSPGPGIRLDEHGNQAVPAGTVSLYTWTSRRMLLQTDGSEVIGCLIANGDPFDPTGRIGMEQMTSWRQTAADLKSKAPPVLRARRHDAERALWRGLPGVTARPHGTELVGSTTRASVAAGVIRWNALLQYEELIEPDELVEVRAYGLKLDANSAIVQDVFEDRISLRSALLSQKNPELIAAAEQAARDTESAVYALGRLAQRIADAAGNRDSEVRGRASAAGFFAVDGPFRQWIVEVGPEADREAIVREWHETARAILLRLARDLVEQSPPAAIIGRATSFGQMSTPIAERRFRYDLDAAFPLSAAASEARARREERARTTPAGAGKARRSGNRTTPEDTEVSS
nr:type I-E CRISPR-associated protein Cse1/CasA [Pseudoclavibacter chungangensis]